VRGADALARLAAPLVETVRSALRTLRINKLRSALTLLGIVIGVVAVVTMAAAIEGLHTMISRNLSQLGSGVFQVQKEGFGDPQQYERRKDFTLADVELLQTRCQRCLQVGGEVWDIERDVDANGRAIRTMVSVVGGTAAFFDNNGYARADGRFFEEGEALGTTNVAVIGADVVDLLFLDQDAVGGTIRIHGRRFRVIGTIARRGQLLGGSLDNLVVMPIGAFGQLYGTQRSLHITVQARDPAAIERTQDEVIALLRRFRGVPPEEENDFELFSNASLQETFDELTVIIAAASIGICAIALLIGGIGVMNIMLVSVTERTSEIGLRRALGARRRRILAQFLVEAVLLTSVGGLLGVLLGAGLAELIHVIVQLPTEVPRWAVILSMASAGGVGLVFGIYPAMRAARLDPVEAMRRE
jgi:putative ABC transport system permease protein